MKRLHMQLLALICCVSMLFSGCGVISEEHTTLAATRAPEKTQGQSASAGTTNKKETASEMKVHFIDVGQGDSILVESNGHYMLIDAGENNQGKVVVNYLKDQGVKKLDFVIGTHPHSDHIGGLDTVIDSFDVGKVILPAKEHTTKTFTDVLKAIEKKKLKITKPVVGTDYKLGDASFTIIAPNKDYKDELNNWSVGIKLTNGENSFVMCGDAELEAEYDICDNGIDLTADVLKLSHHGSRTSSSEALLKAVKPKYAVISVGTDNSYGHPHSETMAMLKKDKIEFYRTDLQGTIVAVSDGTKITFDHKKCTDYSSGTEDDSTAAVKPTQTPKPTVKPTQTPKPSQSADSSKQVTYVLNTSSKKFHKENCASVKSIKDANKETYKGTRQDLIDQGYEPCKKCNP